MFHLFTPFLTAAISGSVAVASALGVPPEPLPPLNPDTVKPSVFLLKTLTRALATKHGSTEPRKMTDSSECSAFAVDSTHLLTARHCLDQTLIKGDCAKAYFGPVGAFMPTDGPSAPQNLVDVTITGQKLSLKKPDDSKSDISKAKVTIVSSMPGDESDMALLQVSGLSHPLTPLHVAKNPPKLLTEVYAAGYPGKLTGEDGMTVFALKKGTVAAQDVQIKYEIGFQVETLISAPIDNGMSGGPVVNQADEVEGVNDAMDSQNRTDNFMSPQPSVAAFLAEWHIATTPAPLKVSLARVIEYVVVEITTLFILAFLATKVTVAGVRVVRRRKAPGLATA